MAACGRQRLYQDGSALSDLRGSLATREVPSMGHQHERYEFVRKLGEGAAAEVYEGLHRQLGLKVALKVLHRDCLTRGNSRRRFINEATTIARLSHPHLVSILDVGETSAGVPFMALEFLQGSDLRELLRAERRLPVARAARLLQQACWGVACAHRAGLVHRDLKPENLFVVQPEDGPETCKVIDFGLARRDDEVALTREGALVGTVGYMAPEQARVERVDERADVYALGVILYEALCGAPPYASDSDEVTLFRIMNEAPCAPRKHVPDIPRALSELIERTLAKDPAARPASAAELGEALQRFIDPTAFAEEPQRAKSLEADNWLARCATVPETDGSAVGPEWSSAPSSDDSQPPGRRGNRGTWKFVGAGTLLAAIAAVFVQIREPRANALPSSMPSAELGDLDPGSTTSPPSELPPPSSPSAARTSPAETSSSSTSSSPPPGLSKSAQYQPSKAVQTPASGAPQPQLRPSALSHRTAVGQPDSLSSTAKRLPRMQREGFIVDNPYGTD